MDLSREISDVVARFAERVAMLAREAAYTQVVDMLSDERPPPAVDRAARAGGPAASAGGRGRRAGTGGRRPPEELERLRARLLDHVRAHPGQRIEQIKVALATTTAALAVPLQKLLYADLVRTEGERRATRYYPAGPGAGADAGDGADDGDGDAVSEPPDASSAPAGS